MAIAYIFLVLLGIAAGILITKLLDKNFKG